VNTLGETVISGLRIGFSLLQLYNIPAFAVAAAAAPIVGQALGAGKPALARRTVWRGTWLVAVAMLAPLILLMVRGGVLGRILAHDEAIAAETARLLLVVPASSYFFGVLTVLLAAFYGSGHTRPALAIAIVRLWFLRIPIALLLVNVFEWGSMGAYVAMVAANIVCALLALWLFLRGEWESVIIHGAEEKPLEGLPAAETTTQAR
jgi:Na+-driven multidrug efflux pump